MQETDARKLAQATRLTPEDTAAGRPRAAAAAVLHQHFCSALRGAASLQMGPCSHLAQTCFPNPALGAKGSGPENGLRKPQWGLKGKLDRVHGGCASAPPQLPVLFSPNLPPKPLPWAMPSLCSECQAQIGSMGMTSELQPTSGDTVKLGVFLVSASLPVWPSVPPALTFRTEREKGACHFPDTEDRLPPPCTPTTSGQSNKCGTCRVLAQLPLQACNARDGETETQRN